MAQIGAEGPRDAFFKISKNSQKSQNSNFKILVHHFFASVSCGVLLKAARSRPDAARSRPDASRAPSGRHPDGAREASGRLRAASGRLRGTVRTPSGSVVVMRCYVLQFIVV